MVRSIQRFVPIFLITVFGSLTLTGSASAETPLPLLLRSEAARFLFTQSSEGSDVLTRLLRRADVGANWNQELVRLLRRPQMRQAADELTAKLTRLQERFGQATSQDDAARIFSQAEAGLSVAERDLLRQMITEEFDNAFLTQMGDRASAYTTARANFREAALTHSPGTKIRLLSVEKPDSDLAVAYRAYQGLAQRDPLIGELFPRQNVLNLLADEEMLSYVRNFRTVMERLSAEGLGGSTHERVEQALRGMLEGQVPEATIAARVAGLSAGTPDALRRAMGDMSLEETLLLLHGGNPLAPTPESLLGRYIQETGASTVVRTFPKGPATGPGATTEQGPQRLVVAIGPDSFATYQKYFTRENFLIHVHTPNQGTIRLAHNGKAGTYADLADDLRLPTEGTLLPHLVLKTTEAQRATQYFKLGSSHPDIARHPWALEGYCATGGYNSCTQWVGNIPIGDRLVTEYRFPGAIDGYAYNRVPDSPDPRVQVLRPYEHKSDLVKRVWKVPGNEQLADVIGLQRANLAGEFANPGWVAHSLTGSAPIDRVPVVFVIRQDHRAPLDAAFDLHISAQ